MKNDDVTMIDKIKISKAKAEFFWFVIIMAALFGFLAMIGAFQYITCRDKNPDVTVRQCFSWSKK